jgi:ClpP class serine protease
MEGQEFFGEDAVACGLADAVTDYYRAQADAATLARMRVP